MSCGFLLMMELVPNAYQSAVGAGLMVAEGSVQIIWTIYFLTVSKNAITFLKGAAVLNLVTAILCWIFLVESPRYLFGTHQF